MDTVPSTHLKGQQMGINLEGAARAHRQQHKESLELDNEEKSAFVRKPAEINGEQRERESVQAEEGNILIKSPV